VQNPVEKIHERRIAVQQPEEISGLHHRGAIHIGVIRGVEADGLYCNHFMKILIADGLPASAIDALTHPEWTIDSRQSRPPAELAADLKDADALVVRSATKVTSDLIAGAPRLRVIARAGTGVDNVDVAAATARGIVVMNAPGANSLSVAELAMGLILAMARNIPAADASMKASKWEKSKFAGAEIRSKTLGLVGLGRIGQEVASRAHAFEMKVIAHDPFISAELAGVLGVELVTLDDLCARADYISLHLPALPSTRHIFNADRLAKCKKGVRIINTARGELIDEAALADAIERGHVAGAGLDVFETEPPKDWRLATLPQVVATPHIAASTKEAQEQVGTETAAALRDFLKEGIIRNAVNFPSVSLEEYRRLRPFLTLAKYLGLVVAQMGEGRIAAVGVRYYGDLAAESNQLLGSAVLEGVFCAILSAGGVTPVNARTIAAERGIELIESRSTRARNYTSLISVKLHSSAPRSADSRNPDDRWVEGTVFANGSLRLVLVDGVSVESPLDGTLLIIKNNDQPGVIGDVGALLGRHNVNIASFALGRDPDCIDDCAIGVVRVDEQTGRSGAGNVTDEVLDQIQAIPNIRSVWRVRLKD
jgi:D-3-phosphoglycerate dehydrogenase / 2-oxoglutarate reductase